MIAALSLACCCVAGVEGELPSETTASAEPTAETGVEQASSPTERPKVAVMIEGVGVPPALAEELAEEMAEALHLTRQLAPVTRAEVLRILSFEEQRQLLGCAEPACFTDLGGVLATRYLVTGRLAPGEDGYRLSLQLIDPTAGEVLNRQIRALGHDPVARGEAARASIQVLVRSLLDLRQGDLAVLISEPEAEVVLDGQLIGLSPIRRLQTAGGMHELRVELEGFHPVARDVRVAPGEVSVEQIQLVPSQRFIDDYRSTTQARRDWGIGLTVAGGALTATALGLLLWEQQGAGALAAEINGFNEGQRVDASLHADLAGRRQATITRAIIWTLAGLIGLAAGGTGGYLWGTARDPDLYSAFESAQP